MTSTTDPWTTIVLDTDLYGDLVALPDHVTGVSPIAFDRGPAPITNTSCYPETSCTAWAVPPFSEFNFALLSDVVSLSTARASAIGTARAESRPSLMVVGLGIRYPGQLTDETRRAIASADRVFYASDRGAALSEGRFAAEVAAINPRSEAVPEASGGSLKEELDRQVNTVLETVRAGERVCFVTYGHPGICYYICHELIRRARLEKIRALMLPAVSSLDGLFADLAFDPAAKGLQVFDAIGFVARKKKVDDTIPIVLLQPYLLDGPAVRPGR